MKKMFWLLALPMFCLLLFSCKNNCDKEVAVLAVQPNTNPAGYEVLLKTQGFSNTVKVVFGNLEAETRVGGESGDIIAKVPAGLSGNVEISVEEGDCIARFANFIVSGALPTNVQPSLPIIIIPTTPNAFPINGIGNVWVNAAATFDDFDTPDYTVFIDGSGVFIGDTIYFGPSSEEQQLINGNQITNPASGYANIKTGEVKMDIDRSLKGGFVEHFEGRFIAVPAFLPANTEYAMLLVSRETGRQMLLFPA